MFRRVSAARGEVIRYPGRIGNSPDNYLIGSIYFAHLQNLEIISFQCCSINSWRTWYKLMNCLCETTAYRFIDLKFIKLWSFSCGRKVRMRIHKTVIYLY